MGFREFLGNERIVAALRGALRAKRVPHALLFTGPRGVGKFTLARMFAQAANCERLTDDFCGECATCQRISLLADPQKLIEQGLVERGESADAATVERIPLILQSHPDALPLVRHTRFCRPLFRAACSSTLRRFPRPLWRKSSRKKPLASLRTLSSPPNWPKAAPAWPSKWTLPQPPRAARMPSASWSAPPTVKGSPNCSPILPLSPRTASLPLRISLGSFTDCSAICSSSRPK